MHWLLTTHVRRYLRHYHHTGHVWQGRFKGFPIQDDAHLLTVLRYVERNPLRASLVGRAEDWPWSSLCAAGTGPKTDECPVPRTADWRDFVNASMTEAEVDAIRLSIRRDRPFGADTWIRTTAEQLGLGCSLRNRGHQPLPAELEAPRSAHSVMGNSNAPFARQNLFRLAFGLGRPIRDAFSPVNREMTNVRWSRS